MPYDFPSGVPTGTVVTVPDGSYRVWDSQKWRASPSANVIIPPAGFLPLTGGTITPGSLNIMPPTMTPAAPFAPLFHTSSSFTGTVTPPADGTHPAVHLWEITNDNASYGHSGQTGFRLVHTYGGSGFDGGRTGMTVRLTQVAGATGTVPQASNQQRIALNAEVYACDNAAGTDSTDYTKVAGGIYSINTYTRMYGPGTVAGAGGATNFLDCLGMNMEMLMETGTSVANKSMILFTLDAGDHVQGSIVDACLNFANGGGDAAIVGWQNLLATGRPDGKWPMNWTGNLWGTYHGSAPYRMQVAYGLNWGDIYFTSGAIKSPGFLLDGNGNINTGALQIATSGQTTTLDTKLIHVVSATVVPGSSVGAWGPTMGMYDNLGNQWIPNTLGGTGGTQLLSVTLVSPAYITGPAPTNPVTVISQSGPTAQAQLNLTWSTSPGTLALQPSGGATVFGGPVSYTATGGTTPRTAQDRAADVVNVLDYGAVGDGVTIDSAAIQAAATAIPSGGGVLWFPPGRTYLVDRTTFLKSNTTVCGEGPASLIRAIEGTWMNPPYTPTNTTGAVLQNAIFMNVNWDVMVAIDQNIQVTNMGFHSAEPTASPRKVPVAFRMAQKVSTRGCHFYGSGNGPTHLACTDVEVSGNRIINFHSGGIEFWENCSGARVTNNYLVKAAVSSDPCIEFTSTTSSNGPGHSYKLLCANNIVLGGATGVFAIGITDTDTVAKTSTVEDIIISDNVVDLAGNYGGGGAVTGAQGIGCYGGGGNYLITNNLIQNIVDGRALYVSPNGRNTPRSVTISGNRAKNCTAVTGTGALVNILADFSSVMDNDMVDCSCIIPYVIAGNSNILRLGVLSAPGSSGTFPRYWISGVGAIVIDPDLTLGRITHGNEIMSSVGFRVGSGSLLANYIENGAWTPSLQFGGVTTGITYSTQTGVYQRVGKMVYVSCQITLTSKGAAAGNAQITGLPFSQVSPTVTRLNVSTAQNFNTITTEPCVRINSNVIALATTGLSTGVNLTDANFANSSVLAINGWFLTA